jgi:hypothetical protein
VTGQCRDGKRHQHRRHQQLHELVEQVAAKPRTISTAITTTGTYPARNRLIGVS